MTRDQRRRFHVSFWGLGLSLAMWAGLVGWGLLRGADWPHATPAVPEIYRTKISTFESWENFITIGIIVEVFLLKAWAMAVRTRRRTWLGTSLILVDLAVALVFLWTMGSVLFHWQTTDWSRRILLRWPLIATGLFAIVMVSSIPDEGENEPE